MYFIIKYLPTGWLVILAIWLMKYSVVLLILPMTSAAVIYVYTSERSEASHQSVTLKNQETQLNNCKTCCDYQYTGIDNEPCHKTVCGSVSGHCGLCSGDVGGHQCGVFDSQCGVWADVQRRAE